MTRSRLSCCIASDKTVSLPNAQLRLMLSTDFPLIWFHLMNSYNVDRTTPKTVIFSDGTAVSRLAASAKADKRAIIAPKIEAYFTQLPVRYFHFSAVLSDFSLY